MGEFWEDAFACKQLMWGLGASRSALLARDHLLSVGAKDVLVPGIGYGRNAKVLVDAGMSVTVSVLSKRAPMYGQGERLGENWYRMPYGVDLFFYDAAAIERELGPHGLREYCELDEPTGGTTHPFFHAICVPG